MEEKLPREKSKKSEGIRKVPFASESLTKKNENPSDHGHQKR